MQAQNQCCVAEDVCSGSLESSTSFMKTSQLSDSDRTDPTFRSSTDALEYRTLPAHRRLWSWGWSSTTPSVQDVGRSAASTPYPQTDEQADAVAWAGHFPTGRGGVVKFTLSATNSFSIAIGCQSDSPGNTAEGQPWTGVRIGSQSAELVYVRGRGHGLRVLASAHFPGVGFGAGERSTFWLSFDPDHCTIKYGKGSQMSDRTFLTFTFMEAGLQSFNAVDQHNIGRIFSHTQKLIELRNYTGAQVIEHNVYEIPLMEQHQAQAASVMLDNTPLVNDPSPRLLDAQQMLLSDFDQRDFTFPSQLTSTGQTLAEQVLQPWLSLEAAGEEGHPGLAEAIAYSLQTKGATLNTILQEKIAQLPAGAPREQTHITVALAPPQGSSPGPPVTLEILPSGHSTPPHNNANAHGVLRVLHGFLDVSLFDSCLQEADEASPLDEVELDFGDAMWFSPRWYQAHSMRNEASQFCCYVLARQYAADDLVRWPYIDYKAFDGKVEKSRVGADCDFRSLKPIILGELQRALEQNPNLLKKAKLSDLERASSARTEAWVERTDSALEYTALSDLELDTSSCPSKQHRFSCGPFRPRRPNRYPEPRFLFSPPAIAEEPAENLKMMWP